MSYIDDETSATNSRPAEAYEFEGTFASYRYTSYKRPVSISSVNYTPKAIRRSAINLTTQDSSDGALEIELPFDDPLVKKYAYEVSPPTLNLIIRRFHEGNPNDAMVIWNGRITAFQVTGRIAKLRSPSKFSYMLNSTIPSCRFQGPCNHVLYDARCGVPKTLHQMTAKVTNINGANLRLNTPIPAGEYAGGMISSTMGESRMISSHVGDQLVVKYPFSNLSAGASVVLQKGCDHNLTGHCTTRFANSVRFGGFPLVPDRNPFTSNLS